MTRVNKRTFLSYTLLFLLIAAIIYTPFLLEGKSFIHQGDGYHQHYPFFRQYLNMIRAFFETGNWQQWDWSIGLGQDTLLTYGYYVVGDPFVYLGLLFPEGAEELAFHVVMFVRIWTVGASFLLYARQMKFGHWSSLAATITYTFSHFVIYNVVRHPFFIHPLIFFPLLALGIEKAFQKESGAFFALMIGLAAISNFYFFYMLTLLAFFYALMRYPDYGKGCKVFTQWFLKFVAFYLVGLLVSAVVFLPQVYGFLSASRSASFPPISLWAYPIEYYGLLILNALTPGTKFWTVGGLSIVAVLTLPFLACNRRKNLGLFWGLVLLSIMLLFPFFGSMMNGFSGPYNRFSFIFPFLLAISLAYFLDHLGEMGEKDLRGIKWILTGFTLIYTPAALVTNEYPLYLTPLAIGWCAYFSLRKDKQFQKIAVVLVALNMSTNALNFYTPLGKNAMFSTEDYGTIDKSYQNIFDNLEEQLPQDEWYRIGVSSKDNQVRNHYAFLNVNGTNSYASLTNGAVSDFSRMIENSQYQVIQPLRNGIDDRRVVNQALGVRYMITKKENEAYLPAGYTVINQSEDMLVAETEYASPFAYVENQAVFATDLQEIHPVQRESLLADAVIVEDEFEGLEMQRSLPSLTTHYEESNVEIEGASELVIEFDEPANLLNQEVFLYIEGISYESPGNDSYRIHVDFNQQSKTIVQSNPYSFSSYFKRENILFHLNEMTDEEKTMTIQFQDEGHYHFDKVSVVSRPYNETEMSSFAERGEERALVLEVFEDEYVKGTVETEAGILVTNIPYSAGWTALVDGEEVDTEKVNTGFIGIPLSTGDHTIEFVYETPFLKIGFILTIFGLVGIFVYSRKYSSKDMSIDQ